MTDEQEHDGLLDLTAAERFFRSVAEDARAVAAAGRWVSDTAECHRLVVDELDRLRARLRALEGEGPHLDLVDEKSRGEAYMRGHRDGRLAERAGIGRDETLVSGTIYVGPVASRPDPPPFAPELADAPLPTGESGAPAPLVVDQPVHDSTLPAELEENDRG